MYHGIITTSLICWFSLYSSTHRHPWISQLLGQLLGCGSLGEAPPVHVCDGQISHFLAARSTYCMLSTSESCRWCRSPPLLFFPLVPLPVYQPPSSLPRGSKWSNQISKRRVRTGLKCFLFQSCWEEAFSSWPVFVYIEPHHTSGRRRVFFRSSGEKTSGMIDTACLNIKNCKVETGDNWFRSGGAAWGTMRSCTSGEMFHVFSVPSEFWVFSPPPPALCSTFLRFFFFLFCFFLFSTKILKCNNND